MANTTNFGWETPDDTDLVKDGAAAMRTLGNAIDASLVDLKGGTTNQILAKNSNTDMDFKWVANDVGDITAVTAGTGLSGGGTSGDVTLTNTVATTFDAKGDLVVGTGADTFAKLVAGSNGDTLVADSSTTTGLRWQGTPSASNPILNSSFDIWQRGTSIASGAGAPYTADRWQIFRSGAASGATVSRQNTSDTTNLPFIQYGARVQRDSGNTSTATFFITNNFETVNSIPYAGRTVTLSFYARRGANFSSASNLLNANIRTGTGTDQTWVGGYTGLATPLSTDFTLTDTWQRFSASATLSASLTELAVQFAYTPVGTAGANDWFEVTGVQIDIGSVALPYRRNSATLAGELAACQRYYWRFTGGNGNFAAYGTGLAGSTTQCDVFVQFPTTMRIRPTTVEFATLALGDGNATVAVTTLTVLRSNELGATLAAGTTGLTQYRPHQLLNNNNSTTAYLGVSAEL